MLHHGRQMMLLYMDTIYQMIAQGMAMRMSGNRRIAHATIPPKPVLPFPNTVLFCVPKIFCGAGDGAPRAFWADCPKLVDWKGVALKVGPMGPVWLNMLPLNNQSQIKATLDLQNSLHRQCLPNLHQNYQKNKRNNFRLRSFYTDETKDRPSMNENLEHIQKWMLTKYWCLEERASNKYDNDQWKIDHRAYKLLEVRAGKLTQVVERHYFELQITFVACQTLALAHFEQHQTLCLYLAE